MPQLENNNEIAQRLIGSHLRRRALVAPPVTAGEHLDEDSLSVFIEGRLSEGEAAPLVSHLVGCGSCRRITAQLIRLEEAIGETAPMPVAARQQGEPSRIRRLLAELSARVLPASDDAAVFAYHAPAEDFSPTEDQDPDRQNAEGATATPENEPDK